MGWRQWMYDGIYRRGARWDTGSSISTEIQEIIAGTHALPAGRALDLGCGTGAVAIYLAQHGWQTIGIDFSSVAIQEARDKANSITGLTFIQGDVTRLTNLGVQGPFDFVLDIGCFHGVPFNRRQAYVHGVVQVTRPGAIFLLWAYSSNHRFRAPGAPFMTKTEIQDRFSADFTVDILRQHDSAAEGHWEATLYALHRR
jgi:cyclopropane fatty-acyl-phospholipid synthase-like methyltransferase